MSKNVNEACDRIAATLEYGDLQVSSCNAVELVDHLCDEIDRLRSTLPCSHPAVALRDGQCGWCGEVERLKGLLRRVTLGVVTSGGGSDPVCHYLDRDLLAAIRAAVGDDHADGR